MNWKGKGGTQNQRALKGRERWDIRGKERISRRISRGGKPYDATAAEKLEGGAGIWDTLTRSKVEVVPLTGQRSRQKVEKTTGLHSKNGGPFVKGISLS